MSFDEKEFAKKIVSDLALLRYDIETLKSLSADQRKAVMKKVLNLLIDVPAMPEFIEALMFSFVVEYMEHFIKSKVASK